MDLIWLESTELAIDKRKFLLNRLFLKQTNHKTRPTLIAILCSAHNTNVFKTSIPSPVNEGEVRQNL